MEVAKEELVLRAKWAQQAQRYDDMVAAMKSVAETGIKLSNKERDLLSDAYKEVVVARISSWKKVRSVEQNPEGSERNRQIAKEYREEVETELRKICREVLTLLDKFLIPKASNDESKVRYLMMKGDYYRYLVEVATTDTKKTLVADSQKAYQESLEISNSKLASTNPIRLGIALNFSVFYFEILSKPRLAYSLATQAFDLAFPELDTLDEDSYRQTTSIMQLLRANLTDYNAEEVEDE